MYSKRTWWPVLSASVFALLAITLSSVRAQNLPPPGAYQPIPNFTGVGAGLQFREAINSRFSGTAPMLPMLVGPTFANLPAEQDGVLLYCQDCKRTTPCGNGGAGAFAVGTRGQWSCSTAALEASLNANGNKITSLANGTVSGDALAFGQTSGGDLAGSLPNPTVATVLGGQAPIYSGQTGALINTLAGARGDGSDALVNFNVNGVLNVRAHGAKGDGVTNDWAAIQNAIYAACNATPPAQPSNVSHGVVYLPPTRNNATYLISQPLQITCGNITVMGASDRNTTRIQAGYEGPTFIVEGYGENNFPILATDPGWASSTAYPQSAEIKDSNGNIEVATTPGTSGTAAHPTWATSQGSTTADGSVTWTLEVIGTQLATGTGSAASLQATAIQSNVELLNLGDDPQLFSGAMNGSGAITVEGYFLAPTYGTNNIYLLATSQADPGTLSAFYTPDSFYIEACGSCSTAGQLKAQLKLSGGTVTITGNTTNLFTPNTTHHVALSYNGSTVYLFLDGTLVGSSAGSGTLVWPAFETWSYAGGAFTPAAFWPDQDGSPEFNTYGAFDDSIRVSNVARYTSGFTKPTAKFTSDANTLLLLNFPTNAPDETQVGVWGSSSAPIYFAVRGNNSTAQTPSVTLENLDVCPTGSDGIFAIWAPASLYDHIRCSAAHGYGINWYNNDFESRANDVFIQGGLGTVGFESGGSDNDSDVNNVQVTGATVGFLQTSGNLRWGTPIYAEPGNDVSYPFVCAGGWGTLIQPFTDIEGSDTNAMGDMWLAGCRWTIIGGEFDLQNNVPNITLHSNNNPPQDFMPTFINSEFSNTVGTNPVFFFDSSFGSQTIAGPVDLAGAATYINLASGSPLTNTPAFVITPDSCNGQVTLASGSGTFSNICVTTASSCTAVDTTTRSNSVTLGTPTNGSVSLTGTGSDVIKMGCR